MKTINFVFIFSLIAFHLQAQSQLINEEYPIYTGDANHPCITSEQYKTLEQRCNANIQLYSTRKSLQNTAQPVSLIWPLKAAAGFNDCSFYFIAAYVDQDTAATTFKDYNCGATTYDGHRGTDIALEPFPFYKMDNNELEVIAAAAGTIIDKHDGEYDRNCLSSGSNVTANYIIIQHADGSLALYWHMKENTVTPKALGQTVVAGEKLGIPGSSGSSSGPHLHFEVWSGTTANTLADPFAGTCNKLNASSWWASQHIYLEPAVVKASVHTTDITFPACGTTEVPNESTSYIIPFQGTGLPAGYAKFYVFLRDQTSGTTVNMSILNPNASVYAAWSYNSVNNYNFSYLNYSKLLPTTAGTYTFNATYNGVTCTQSFDIVVPTGLTEENDKAGPLIYADAENGVLHISPRFGKARVIELFSSIGQCILKTSSNTNTDVSDLKSGLYFVVAINDHGEKISTRIIKE